MQNKDEKTHEIIQFINKQIEYDKQNELRSGITFWGILVSLLAFGKYLLTILFQIEKTDDNIIAISSIFSLIYYVMFIICGFLLIMFINYKFKRIYSRDTFTIRSSLLKKWILVFIMALNLIMFFINNKPLYTFKFNFLILLFMILLSIFYFIYLLMFNYYTFVSIKNKYKNIFSIFKIIKKFNIDKIVCLLLSSLLIYEIINSIKANYSYIKWTELNVTCAILFYLIILHVICLIYLSISRINANLYREIEQEIYTTNLLYDDIILIIKHFIIGKSISNDIDDIIKDTNEYIKELEIRIQKLDSIELINGQIDKAFIYINALINDLNDYFKFKSNYFSIIEFIYNEKWINDLHESKKLIAGLKNKYNIPNDTEKINEGVILTFDNRITMIEELIYSWMINNNINETTPVDVIDYLVTKGIYHNDEKTGRPLRTDFRKLKEQGNLNVFKKINVFQDEKRYWHIIKNS